MAEGIKISALPAAESAAAEDVVAGVQSNTTKKFSLATILAYLQSAFTIGSGTKTALNGILKGNGTTVGTATAGTDYQAAITAQGVLVGGGSGSVSSKTLDDSSLTNDNNHIPTSGVVKSALDNLTPTTFTLTAGDGVTINYPNCLRLGNLCFVQFRWYKSDGASTSDTLATVNVLPSAASYSSGTAKVGTETFYGLYLIRTTGVIVQQVSNNSPTTGEATLIYVTA